MIAAGPSLLAGPGSAGSRSGAAASRFVNGGKSNSFPDVALIDVWSNAVGPDGRMIDAGGT